jgi:hypothetical protein
VKASQTLELRIADMPEVLFALRARMAGILREEADAEADPRIARRLRDLANQFEAGQ